ncbi:tail protein X [Silvimonas sp.]|uniref:tail protein X n=1 Tax=Silvimonas sp. TaxID=2650811 RepID=UPI00284D2CEC|nr:tail protein X [Silvimonas sp.]MDR3429027.1 tail protein X [Silvimonas sp.]
MLVRTHQHDTVDALCWRYYGVTAGMIEKVLAANLHLCEVGVTLPAGLLVEMPDISSAPPVLNLVNLWD